MSSWSIVDSEVNAYVIGSKVYLTGPDKEKKQNSSVTRLFRSIEKPNIPKKVVISENKFQVKIGKHLEVLVYNKNLGEKYYKLVNFANPSSYKEGIGKIISQVPNNCGDFENEEFNLVISDIYTERIFLVSKKMSEYKDCLDEMKRRLGLEIYKKTRKWEPGHVYYNKTSMIYCLAKLKSRKSDEYKSSFSDPSRMADVFLITESIDSEKSVSEVFKNRSFGGKRGQIQISFKPEAMVDGGEVLKNDIGTDFSVFWEDLVKNTISDNKLKTDSSDLGYYNYSESLSNVVKVLTTQSNGYEDYSLISKNILSDLTDLTRNYIFNLIVSYWNGYIKDHTGTKKEDYIAYDLFFRNIYDTNSEKKAFYLKFYETLGIDLVKLSLEELSLWDSGNLRKQNLTNYIKYSTDLSYRSNFTVDQRSKSISTTNSDKNRTLSEYMKKDYPELLEVIVDITKNAEKDYGAQLENWRIVNNGTYRAPKEYISICISVRDIVNRYGGLDKVPEKISSEIINNNFSSIQILYDYGSPLKV